MADTQQQQYRSRSYRIYKPRKEGGGCASEWQLVFKETNKYDPFMMFLIVAPQGQDDAEGNSSFGWKENAITMKMSEVDIGEILATFEGRQGSAGRKGLYHETPGGGNKNLSITAMDNGGYGLRISAQDKDKKVIGPYQHMISNAEASILTVLLKRAVEAMYNW